MSNSLRGALGALLVFVGLAPIAALAETETPTESEADRLVLAPLNLGVTLAPELEPGLEPVWQALLDHVENEPARVASLEGESAKLLWARAVASLEATEEPDLYATYSQFAKNVAEHFEFKTLVMPVLVTRVASLRGSHAHWDGVRHRADLPDDLVVHPGSMIGLGILQSEVRIRGELGAASLHIVALDSEGNLMHEGNGGLDLLHKLTRRGSRVEAAMRTDPFGNERRLREGVEQALSMAVPAARAPAH